MANRNDPERLEKEAMQMMEDLKKQSNESEASATQEVEEEVIQEAPEEQADQAEEVAAEAPSEEEESGEQDSKLDELLSKVDKAERAMKGAQAKMTKSNQEASELRKSNAELLKVVENLKGQLLEKSHDASKLKQLREDYPDFAPLLDQNEALRAEVARTNDSLIQKEKEQEKLLHQQAQAAHDAKIAEAHPDVVEIIGSSDWLLWVDAQDEQTQYFLKQGSYNDVIAVIDRFKEDLKFPTPTPRETALEKAEQAASPKMPKARRQKVGGKKTWTVDDITKMPLSEFEKNKAQILKDYAEGAIRR